MSTSLILSGKPAGAGATPNRFVKFVFNNAPAEMEFAVRVGASTQDMVFRGDVDAETLQVLLEGCDDLAGYGVDVFGGTEQSGTSVDGTALYSGTLIAALHGTAPYPAWGQVQNSEMHSFVVEGVDGTDVGFVVSGAGSTALNGTYLPDGTNDGVAQYSKDASGYLYRHSTSHSWKLGTTPEAFDPEGEYVAYTHGSTQDSPSLTGWATAQGTSPAPVLAWNDGNYSLNGGSDFKLAATAANLQSNQQALGGDYAGAAVKGFSLYRNLLSGSSITHDSGVYAGVITNVIDEDDQIGIWFTGTVNIVFDRGEGAPEVEIGSISMVMDATSTTLTTSGDGTTYGAALSPGDTLKRFVKFNMARYDGPVLQELRIAPVEFNTVFHSYFPFSAGNVPAPAATGENAVTGTLHEHGSASTLVTCGNADIESLLIAGLQNPANTAPVSNFTPQAEHWYSPLPATEQEAADRIAAAFYNWWLYPIPNQT